MVATGTFQCSAPDFFSLQVQVIQGDGQHQNNGFGSTSGNCSGGIQARQVTVGGGPFHTGKAVARADLFTFGQAFSQKTVDRTIHLSG